jgi:hypothetical protein
MNDKKPDVSAGQDTDVRAAEKVEEPSKPWFGALILACLALAAVWVLTYTLAPLPGQNALGGWNYAIVGLLLVFFIGLSMEWHGDPPER